MDERSRDILRGLTANPALPDHLRARLPAPPHDTVRPDRPDVDPDVARAADPATPPDEVIALLDHSDMSVRWALAGRADLPRGAQERLAADRIPVSARTWPPTPWWRSRSCANWRTTSTRTCG